MPANICQTEPSSLVFVYKFFVVDAKQVQQGSMKIVHMHRISYNVVAKIVCFAKRKARFHAGARHPHRKAARVVVASIIVGR